jgi:hypothetical protein
MLYPPRDKTKAFGLSDLSFSFGAGCLIVFNRSSTYRRGVANAVPSCWGHGCRRARCSAPGGSRCDRSFDSSCDSAVPDPPSPTLSRTRSCLSSSRLSRLGNPNLSQFRSVWCGGLADFLAPAFGARCNRSVIEELPMTEDPSPSAAGRWFAQTSRRSFAVPSRRSAVGDLGREENNCAPG